jgi:murein DD-endopeptidase MepM/ murein hydrolase activator NlpD
LIQRLLFVAAAVAVAMSLVPARAFAGTTKSGDFIVEVFPLTAPDVHFRDTWGARRPGGRRHRGTDLIGPRGSPVLAVAAGTVSFMDWQRLSGYTIKIEHDGDWTSTYMHLNNDSPGTDDGRGGPEGAFAPGLEVGVHVEAGQLIGWVGDSGNAEDTTPHTHFELKHEGTKLNPFPYLAAAWRHSPQQDGPTAD